jgi:molybdenum cofactor synthesis domain-containing protein
MRVAILTLSDKGAAGERIDRSGPALKAFLEERGATVCKIEILPDDKSLIAEALKELCDAGDTDLILTTGGTGVSPRDVTPEATMSVIERDLPGFGEAMRMASMEKTPHAIISRALAGIRGDTLIINLPGSPKGAIENIEAVWPAVPHAVAKIQGDKSDCAG